MKLISGKIFISAFMIGAVLLGCNPSPYILQKHAFNNFKDEGFLSSGMVQTIGQAKRVAVPGGSKASRQMCLESALETAVQRTLRVFVHTKFDIMSGGAASKTSNNNVGLGTDTKSTFQKDYPMSLTERDYIRAELDFRPLLKKGFIALQDSRSKENCTIVFRIIVKNISKKIRKTPVTFQPDNYRQKGRGYQRPQDRTKGTGQNPNLNPGGNQKTEESTNESKEY